MDASSIKEARQSIEETSYGVSQSNFVFDDGDNSTLASLLASPLMSKEATRNEKEIISVERTFMSKHKVESIEINESSCGVAEGNLLTSRFAEPESNDIEDFWKQRESIDDYSENSTLADILASPLKPKEQTTHAVEDISNNVDMITRSQLKVESTANIAEKIMGSQSDTSKEVMLSDVIVDEGDERSPTSPLASPPMTFPIFNRENAFTSPAPSDEWRSTLSENERALSIKKHTPRKSSIPRVQTNSPCRSRSPYRGNRQSFIPSVTSSSNRKVSKLPIPKTHSSSTPTRIRIGSPPMVPGSAKRPVSAPRPYSANRPRSAKGPGSATRPVSRQKKRIIRDDISVTPSSLPFDEKPMSPCGSVGSQRSYGSYLSDPEMIYEARKTAQGRAVDFIIEENKQPGMQACKNRRWNPNLFKKKRACDRCLFLASDKEKRLFAKNGRHPVITMTTGGCTKRCQEFRGFRQFEDGSSLCRICFNATHRPKEGLLKDDTCRSLQYDVKGYM
jgi:hypothetical protein